MMDIYSRPCWKLDTVDGVIEIFVLETNKPILITTGIYKVDYIITRLETNLFRIVKDRSGILATYINDVYPIHVSDEDGTGNAKHFRLKSDDDLVILTLLTT